MFRLPQFLLFLLLTLSLPQRSNAQEVDVALALAVDVSYSVDDEEHGLQVRGLAAALASPEVLDAIAKGQRQKIALAVYVWASDDGQRLIVPWTIIDGKQAAEMVGAQLLSSKRMIKGGTSISGALMFGASLFDSAPPAERRVIDVSTDGNNNMGRSLRPTSKFVVGQGITVNGLAISDENEKLMQYLERSLIGGPAAFAEQAWGYENFGIAITRKLVREIIGPGIS